MTSTGVMSPTVEVTLSVNTYSLGEILTGEAGRTVYVFTKDTNGTSVCYDSCAQNWPAVLTMGAPKGGADVDASLLGTTTRKDGTLQVTYNGMPLYYYAKDTVAGDVNGQEVGDVWYVIAPNGKMIEK